MGFILQIVEVFYFRISTVRSNRLRNKHLTEYLRISSNDLATVRISVVCGAMLSNNSMQRYDIYLKRRSVIEIIVLL